MTPRHGPGGPARMAPAPRVAGSPSSPGGWSVAAQPRPPFTEGKGVVARVAMRGEGVVNFALREVGRGAPLVLEGLVASAAASAVRVPSPNLVRSRRYLGRGERIGGWAGGGAEGGAAVSGTQA